MFSPLCDRLTLFPVRRVVILVGWLEKCDGEWRVLVDFDGTYFRVVSRKKQLKSLAPGSYVIIS